LIEIGLAGSGKDFQSIFTIYLKKDVPLHLPEIQT
jgi:hypothetical protein